MNYVKRELGPLALLRFVCSAALYWKTKLASVRNKQRQCTNHTHIMSTHNGQLHQLRCFVSYCIENIQCIRNKQTTQLNVSYVVQLCCIENIIPFLFLAKRIRNKQRNSSMTQRNQCTIKRELDLLRCFVSYVVHPCIGNIPFSATRGFQTKIDTRNRDQTRKVTRERAIKRYVVSKLKGGRKSTQVST